MPYRPETAPAGWYDVTPSPDGLCAVSDCMAMGTLGNFRRGRFIADYVMCEGCYREGWHLAREVAPWPVEASA